MNRSQKLQGVQVRIGYTFARDDGLLWQALSLAGSLASDADGNQFPQGNKRLAGVGDAALAMVVKKKCFEEGLTIGDTTERVRITGNNDRLPDFFQAAGLMSYMNTNPSQGFVSSKSQATTIEAILGAVYLDSGCNLETVRAVMQTLGLIE